MVDVVVTNASSTTALALIRSLGKQKIPVIASDSIPYSIGFISKYCKQHFLYENPYENPQKTLETLTKIGKTLGKPILMPAGDDVLLLATKYRTTLDQTFILSLPPNNTLKTAIDREQTLKLASKLNIPTPKTFTPTSTNELKEINKKLKYPIIIKPRTSGGFRNKFGQKILKVWSLKQLIKTYTLVNKFFPKPLVQEYIPGGVQNLYSLCTIFNQKHNPLGTFSIKKLHQLIEGVTACGEPIEDKNLTNLSIKILKTLKWIGPAEVEFKKDPRDNTLKLMEINPRPFMWINLPIHAGFDIPHLWYKIATGEKCRRINKLEKNLRFINLFHHLLGLINQISHEENKKQTIKNSLKALKGHFVFDLLSTNDILPFFSYPLLFSMQIFHENLSRKQNQLLKNVS
jgi:predicted ATP-grasp superfamily ATP-dependent carboligase